MKTTNLLSRKTFKSEYRFTDILSIYRNLEYVVSNFWESESGGYYNTVQLVFAIRMFLIWRLKNLKFGRQYVRTAVWQDWLDLQFVRLAEFS